MSRLKIEHNLPLLDRGHLYHYSLIVMCITIFGLCYGLWAVVTDGLLLFRDSTRGLVVENSVLSSGGKDGYGETSKYLKLRYEYEVQGRVFTGWRINNGYDHWFDVHRQPFLSFSSPDDREKARADYPPGTQVVVYYEPENPIDSILESGMTKLQWFALLASTFFFCMALYFFRTLKQNEAWAEEQERRRGPDFRLDD